MDRALFLLLTITLLASCRESSPDVPPVRESIGTLYVAVPSATIRERPDESARQIASFQVGETVSVLSIRGSWAEVRLGGEGTGWVMKTSLSSSPADEASDEASETVRFKQPPSPVYSAGGARGEIVLEASVDTNGSILSVRTLRNTTGSKALEAQNSRELQKASFYPLKVGRKLRPFFYEYRISY